MKYIIMCGGDYKFDTPKQLLKVYGEVIVERTIRLLRENGIKDIAISTDNPAFDYLDVEKLRHNNGYVYEGKDENKLSSKSWLNAYYPTDEPACYLHGDVYFSDEAIKKIIETPVKDTMFFCVRDLHDGRPIGVNPKGREPLAYKVENQKVFRKAINDIFEMIDAGKFLNGFAPISWHLYRQLNGMDLLFNAKWYDANNIFNTKGDYTVIDDYTTDVDFLRDIPLIEKFIRIAKGVEKMIKAEVTQEFHLGRFNELKNLVRHTPTKNAYGQLYTLDQFECTEDLAEYLAGKNALGRAFIRVIEVIPAKKEKKEEKATSAKIAQVEEEKKLEEKPKRRTRRKSVAKK